MSKLNWAYGVRELIIVIAGVLIALAVSQPSFGQESSPLEPIELMTVEVAQELLEEVTVVGPRSLQLEAFAAQDTSFGMFNNMIDDENFRITCRREQPEPLAFDPTVTISRPRVRVCSTRYMDRESVREVREFFAGFGDANPSRAIQRHLRSLNEKINELAGEDPEFYLAMRKWRELSTEYLDERAERMSE